MAKVRLYLSLSCLYVLVQLLNFLSGHFQRSYYQCVKEVYDFVIFQNDNILSEQFVQILERIVNQIKFLLGNGFFYNW